MSFRAVTHSYLKKRSHKHKDKSARTHTHAQTHAHAIGAHKHDVPIYDKKENTYNRVYIPAPLELWKDIYTSPGPSKVRRVSRGRCAGGDQPPNTLPHQNQKNNRRGFRSEAAIAKRRIMRTVKRRIARQENRREGRGEQDEKRTRKGHNTNRTKAEERRATAQKPKATTKIPQNQTQWIATLNARGTNKPGTREEIEQWMKDHDIRILLVQETRGKHNSREARKTHTWFFSSENPVNPKYTAGVAIIIENKLTKHIQNIVPINDRLMYLQLDHTTPITIVNCHCPSAASPSEDKEDMYAQIEKIATDNRAKGPVLIGGDFNARLQKPTDDEEKSIIGAHTFQGHIPNTAEMAEDMLENRQLLISLCREQDMLALNTQYRKQENKLATYRKTGAERTTNPTRANHEQLDYWLIGKRWRNMVTDAESDTKANIDSDHYPTKIRCRFALKYKEFARPPPPKPKYHACTERAKLEINGKLQSAMREYETEREEEQIKRFTETMRVVTECLPTEEPTLKDNHYSKETEEILQQRKVALEAGDIAKFEELTKQYRNSKKDDKKQYVIRSVKQDMDVREKWMGIKNLKRNFQPQPYHRKNKQGHTIQADQTAEAFAKHLAEIWKSMPTPFGGIVTTKLPIPDLPYRMHDIDMEELSTHIKRLKKQKATGPDEIPMETFKELDEQSLEIVLKIMNIWWKNEHIDKEYLRATVCLIYKKGSTAALENYRPISLLNSLYKIYAAIIQKGLAEQLDPFLQKTQFGFRKDRSTGDAIHMVRRAAEHGEQTKTQTHMVLLDWEKAFDKINREALYKAMDKMNIPTKYIAIIKAMYTQTEFNITMEGSTSKWYPQETGIRQGCPLSPYLFLIIMTTLFHDIHEGDTQNLIPNRICGANFDEVVCADDTICVSTDSKAMNMFLKDIENEGKCELLTTSLNADIRFADRTNVKKKPEVTYLGCQINQYSNIAQEISKRIPNCMTVLKD